MSSSSGKTEESLTAFADSTLRTLAANDPSLDISFLPAPDQPSQPELHGISPMKASESETLRPNEVETHHTILGIQSASNLPDESSGETSQSRARHYFETDASEVEDLYDSTGVDGIPDRSTSSIVDLNRLSAEGEGVEMPKPVDKEVSLGSQTAGPKLPEQMSANGRALLRKHFSSTNH